MISGRNLFTRARELICGSEFHQSAPCQFKLSCTGLYIDKKPHNDHASYTDRSKLGLPPTPSMLNEIMPRL